MQISKSQFKANAQQIFRAVEESGEPVVITDHGQPTLEIRRYIQKSSNPLEALRGSVLFYDRPTEPVNADDWEVLR
jgi:antitoxin (DNA-binding transcriptional repressor) of toxin-antitoxin stability system